MPSLLRIHNAQTLSTVTVRSTVTIQYSTNGPPGRWTLDQSMFGIANSVCRRQQTGSLMVEDS